MTVQFQGIYKLQARQTAGPLIPFKHYDEKQKIVAYNVLDQLQAENPKTAFAALSNAGVYFFQDDAQGDHFSQYTEIMAPVLNEDGFRKQPRGFDTGWYSPWIIGNTFMAKVLEASQAFVDLINKTPVQTIQATYSVEERAGYYNGAQWSNGAADNSDRVRSAIRIESISEPT